MKLNVLTSAAVLATGVLVAGCGSSNGIQQAPSSSVSTTASTRATSTTATTATATTPTSGPLATEPAVPKQSGAPPKTLVTKDLIVGTGPTAAAGDNVTVNYVGALYTNNKIFDASWKRSTPFSFVLGQHQVIAGWDQGVAGMKVGGRRLLVIPSALGYGASGAPGSIPPNAALVFVVDLLGVQPGGSSGTGATG